MPRPLRLLPRVLLAGVGLLVAAPAAAQTRLVYLWYADGGPPPVATGCPANPPPFACDFAATADGCKRTIQAYLDTWYRDMDVVFTIERPSAGDHDTVIVTRDGQWCNVAPANLGRGQLAPACEDLRRGYAIAYQCGTDAKRCATIIAQEQAHLVGLEHTNSERDLMNVNFFTAHEGFEDALNPVYGPQCLREQNSYRKMKERVGAWPGGLKPGPFGNVVGPDAAAGSDGQVDAGEQADGQADVAEGRDAGSDRSPLDASLDASLDAAADAIDGDPGDDVECGCRLGGRPDVDGPGALMVLLAVGLAWRLRGRRRRSGSESRPPCAPGRRTSRRSHRTPGT